ncbi:MAG: branched-chain-amino-acid transaminase [Spirochaetales bacterium]|nr:branched-chain-amino-acid transaminase [Spirochaetales bacterium]
MIYIDGKIYTKENAKISVYDHGLLYGDGVFEGIRIYHGKIFRLNQHIRRLYDSAKAIRLNIPMNPDELAAAMINLVIESEKVDGYIRLVITRGVGDLGLNPHNCKKASIIIIVDDIQLYPKEYYDKGVCLHTSSLRRMPVDSLDPRIKSLNYLNNIMAKLEAIDAGCPEAIILNKEGHVVECSADNLFYIHNSALCTPMTSSGALEGITRGVVIELAEQLGILWNEKITTLYDLYTADECFLTGSGAEIVPVVGIDNRVIGSGMPGETTARIRKAFAQLILQEAHEKIAV